jgi:hypothetical protein
VAERGEGTCRGGKAVLAAIDSVWSQWSQPAALIGGAQKAAAGPGAKRANTAAEVVAACR